MGKRLLLLLMVMVLAAANASPASAKRKSPSETITVPRPVSEAEDPVNRFVEQSVEDGLLLQLRIDGAVLALDGATPARIPRRGRRHGLRGDIVTVTALSGNRPVGSVAVPDPYVDIAEGKGLVRRERRSLVIALPTAGAADAIEVRVSASGITQRFDVNSAYLELCRTPSRSPVCQKSPPPAAR